MKKYILAIALLPILFLAQAQDIDHAKYEQIGYSFLNQNLETLGLTKEDIHNVAITDLYRNNNNDWVQLYFCQTYNDIQVSYATINLNIKPDGSIPFYRNNFVPNLKEKIDSDFMILSASEAIVSSAYELGLANITEPTPLKKVDKTGRRFFAAEFANGDITAQPKYAETPDGMYRTSWEIYLADSESADTWFSHVDAIDGSVISKINNTVYCSVHKGMFHNHTAECRDHKEEDELAKKRALLLGDGAKYNVFEVPLESPIHGPRTIADDPSIEAASPFGWHDVDGEEGPEYTITRGNNVWAFEDLNNSDVSSNNEPDGGAELLFDFRYDPTVGVINNVDADVTQLFYMNNMIHDKTFQIGFDSPSGNFQENTYGEGGEGRDFVLANALDGSGTNNANFATPTDGGSGTMQMFRWSFTDVFRVSAPDDIAKSYGTSQASWTMTPDYTMIDITAEIVIARDNLPNPQLAGQGCGDIVTDVEGKIALIRRGTCEFGRKALNAEMAGAVAAIICNVPGVNGGDGETAMGMGAGAVGDEVTIPVISLAHSDCTRIEIAIASGEVVAQLSAQTDGPGEVSSGFDNGVMAHEYGHGISNRLIGGPSLGGCMTNDEQQGEGISDYFALVMTTTADHKGTDARGIGNFVDGQNVDGRGIRRFPYSTDINICPLSMRYIAGTGDLNDGDPDNDGVHAMGEVWAATLWDIYWAFTDLYGWTDDWSDGSAGNVRAMKLAMDGMKAVGCRPGFKDMRDAILAVDDGEHNCLLWEIFARRGMGYFADFGSAFERDDNEEDFEPLPTCITTLKIKREIATLVTPGDILDVSIEVANHTLETATNVIVTDVLQDGLTIVDGSTSVPYTISGNMILFELGDMATLDETSFTYQLATSPDISSITKIINTSETLEERQQWLQDVNGVGFNFWTASQFDARSGVVSWFVNEVDNDSDQRLEYKNIKVIGEKPAIRFWHRPNCTPLDNGGFIEYSTDGGQIWNDVKDMFIRGGYNNPIVYANLALPGLEGFSGMADEFTDSYIDLSSLKDETIDLRFRFATYDFDEEVTLQFPQTAGWYVDDFELMDIKTYKVEASISADNAETVTDGEKEVIIDSDGVPDGTNTNDISIQGVSLELNPNPASDNVTVYINSDRSMNASLALLSIDGRVIQEQQLRLVDKMNYINLDLSTIEGGMYIVQLRNQDKVLTQKLVRD